MTDFKKPLLASLLVVAACGKGGDGKPSNATPAHPVATTAATSATPPNQEQMIADGALLYTRYCTLCHGANGQGYAADHAPSLVSESFQATATDQFLRIAIAAGRPGTAMGAYGAAHGGPLDGPAMTSLMAYLRRDKVPRVALPAMPVNGDATRGRDVFVASCQRCHGEPPGHGDAIQLWNPQLMSTADNAFLRYAIVHGRNNTPMLAFETTLTATQIDDVVAYLRGLALAPTAAPQAIGGTGLAPGQRPVDTGPVLINPNGKAPTFALREDRFVPAADVNAALDAKKRMVIIDARTPEDWARGHIPGAISVPYYALPGLDRVGLAVDKANTWVLAYCACPHHASGVIVDELRKRGYAHTAIIDEGIVVWQQQGYPTIDATGKPAPPPAAPNTVNAPPMLRAPRKAPRSQR